MQQVGLKALFILLWCFPAVCFSSDAKFFGYVSNDGYDPGQSNRFMLFSLDDWRCQSKSSAIEAAICNFEVSIAGRLCHVYRGSSDELVKHAEERYGCTIDTFRRKCYNYRYDRGPIPKLNDPPFYYIEAEVYPAYGCMDPEVPVAKPGVAEAQWFTPRDSYPSGPYGYDISCHQSAFTCELPPSADKKPEKANGLAGLCGNSSFPAATVGNPIVPTTGNKTHIETDYEGAGPFPLVFRRVYNSQGKKPISGWRHSYERHLIKNDRFVDYIRWDGQREHFRLAGELYISDLDSTASLESDPLAPDTYTFYDGEGNKETVKVSGTFTELQQIQNAQGFTQTLTYDGVNSTRRLSRVTDSFGRILRFEYRDNFSMALIDPTGQKTLYQYDTRERLVEVIRPDGGKTIYHYEDPKNPDLLTGITDPLGKRYATWTYDDQQRAISSEHAGGIERVTLHFDDTAHRVSVLNAFGKTSYYGFQQIKDVPKPTTLEGVFCRDCNAQVASYDYDEKGFLTQIVDRKGVVQQRTYGKNGLLQTVTEAAGTPQEMTTQFDWLPRPKYLAGVVKPGLTRFWGYNNRGLVASETEIDTIESNSRTTTRQYNKLRLVSRTDGPRLDVSDLTTFSYDKSGNLITSTDALGHVTRFDAYDPNGRLLRQIDPNGRVSSFRYTPMGRLAEIKAEGAAWHYRYDLNGQLSALTNPLGQTTQWLYDAAHRLAQIKLPGGDRVERVLNNASVIMALNLYNAEGTLSYQEQYAYNDLGQLVTRTDGAGQTTAYAYDANGQATTVRDAKARIWQTQYDVRNRPTSLIDPAHNTLQLAYNPEGQITTATDALGHTTRFTYNGFGELTSVQSPEAGQTQYFYDEAGLPKGIRTADGHQTQYTYDTINRVTSQSHEDKQHAVTFRYDENALGIGRLTSIHDESGTTRYTYDGQGNLISSTLQTGAFETGSQFTYDLNHQLIKMHYPSGNKVEYARDPNGRVQAITYQGQSIVAGVKRLPASGAHSPVTQYQLGNGVTVSHTYDKAYIRRKTTWTPLPQAETNFQYDLVYNLVGVETPKTKKSYQYDLLDRLVGANVPSPFLWTYDALGNRLSEQKGSAGTTPYTYNSENAQVAQAGKMALTHDAAGHVTQKGDYSYTYGSHRQLTQVSYQGNIVAEYTYNAAHQRAKKVVYENAILKTKPLTTYFVYDLEGRLIAELSSTGAVEREYLYLDQEPVALVEDGVVYYFLNSKLGAPQLLLDSQQQVVWEAEYAPFGEVTIKTQKRMQNIRFPGQYYDAETGLHYNWHRYYDPSIGRYLQPDPIGLAGGVNLYAYVGNNPIRYSDPLGLTPSDWWDPIVHPKNFYNRAAELRQWGHVNFPGETWSDVRHHHTSYLLAKEYSPNWTRLAGIGNEIQGFLWHDIWNLPSRLRGNSPWAFQLRDLLANEVGIYDAQHGGSRCLQR